MADEMKDALDSAQDYLKENMKRHAFKKLEREIIKPGICTECGTCVAICPVDALTGMNVESKYVPTLTGKCTACGMCYSVCPRIIYWREDLLGPYRSILRARSIRSTDGQNGGVASALLAFSVESGKMDNAVIVRSDDVQPWKPIAVLSKNPDEISNQKGTIYTHAPVVQLLLEAFKAGYRRTAVIGTSCNLDAVRNLEERPGSLLKFSENLEVLRIGLFCMESFDYSKLSAFLKSSNIEIEQVKKMEISSGKFVVNLRDSEVSWPVGDLHEAAASSCAYCQDLTCMAADISCGNIGSDNDWTTIIIRTERGNELVKKAVEKGIIQTEPLDKSQIQIIETVARLKAQRYYSLDAHK